MVSTASLRLNAMDLDVALLLVGPDHRISFANAAAHQLLGYPNGGLNGLPLERLIPTNRHGEMQNVAAVFSGQAPRRLRSMITRANGGSVEVSLALEPCHDGDGGVVAVSLRYELLARMSTGSRGLDPEHGPRGDGHESGYRVDASRVARLVAEQVGGVAKLLELLDERLGVSMIEPRELAHARGLLTQARELLDECELDLDAIAPSPERIPQAPKLPRE